MKQMISQNETSSLDTNGFMSNMFQKIENGRCRISLNGQIAIATSNGYKTFSPENGTLVNCSSFVSNFGDNFFYVIPATKVKKGDIILVSGLPRCVIESEKNKLTVMTYETGTIETIIPERQMFMGNIYFYRKIMSPMLGMIGSKGKMNRMMRMMMISDMMNHNRTNTGTGENFMQMIMMQGFMKDMGESFDGMFELFDEDEEE